MSAQSLYRGSQLRRTEGYFPLQENIAARAGTLAARQCPGAPPEG